MSDSKKNIVGVMQGSSIDATDTSARIDCYPVWVVPTNSTDVQPRSPPPSYFSVVNQPDFYSRHYPHHQHIDGVVQGQTVVFLSARRQVTCTGKKIGFFTTVILITFLGIIGPLIWVLIRT